jgi:hypothetical protein
MINVPVSAGELLDKITILRIKKQRIDDPAKLKNVNGELELLEAISDQVLAGRQDCQPLIDELFAINGGLWDIEDGKRDCERRKDFGETFVQLARSVYLENDRRAAVKRRINEMLGSQIVEEKSYKAY